MRQQSIKTERGPVIHLETPDLLKRARYELSRHHPVLLKVSGTAMRPALHDGDLVTVEPVNAQSVRTGDIILYQSLRDTALIHRIVRMEHRSSGRFVVTRGDACATLDVPVPIHHVMGRVTLIDRDGETIEIEPQPTGFRAWLMRMVERLRSAH
ncbi:MAG TPA: signal peptidase I [Blastocatellia bacterium]|nr:signal peptidase I [Blastocatellia bacterium]